MKGPEGKPQIDEPTKNKIKSMNKYDLKLYNYYKKKFCN